MLAAISPTIKDFMRNLKRLIQIDTEKNQAEKELLACLQQCKTHRNCCQ